VESVPDPILTRRARCGRCGLPLATCLCALAVPVDNGVEVLVLQHPREAREAKGSVRLMALSLARCRVVTGEVFEPAVLHRLLQGDGQRSVLLYPEHALAGATTGAVDGLPTRLVVLDATWRKSLRMLMRNEALQHLPRWRLEPDGPAVYAALRKAPRPSQLSSLEACCAALAAIEGTTARYAPLLAAFGRFVAERAARVET